MPKLKGRAPFTTYKRRKGREAMDFSPTVCTEPARARAHCSTPYKTHDV